MKINSYFLIWLVLAFVCFLCTRSVNAQSESKKAINSFKIGVTEKELSKKIAAYKKAIEYDPLFVEALFNLGLVNSRGGDYESAEQYFIRAFEAKPNAIAKEMKVQILYNLSRAQKKLGNLQVSEESLRKAQALARDRTIESKISFELARVLYEQKEYEKALNELKKGIKIKKESKSFFQNLIQIIEYEVEVRRLNQEAEKAIAANDMPKAQSLLQKIQAINPDLKGLNLRLAYVDSVLKSKAEKKFLKELYEVADLDLEKGNLEKAINLYEIILKHSPDYLNVGTKLTEAKHKRKETQIKQNLEEYYANGVNSLQKKNWTTAVISFEQVLELDTEYLDVKNKLAEAKRRLEKENTETITGQYYEDGIIFMNKQKLGAALASFEKVQAIHPKYKDTAALITEIKESLKANSRVAPATNAYFNSLSENAMAAIENKDWLQSLLILEKLRLLAPNDRTIINLLAQARENLKLPESAGKTTRFYGKYHNLVYISSGVVALIALPFLGLVVFSPSTRARVHYLRGNYLKAARIYEKILVKHPDKLKPYIALAKIYRLLGRSDERAMKVFKVLLSLNLAPNLHSQITSVMSQKYLGNGQTDSNSISILENSLKRETQKQDESKT